MAFRLSDFLFWGSVVAAPVNLYIVLVSVQVDSPELKLLALGNLALLTVGVLVNYRQS